MENRKLLRHNNTRKRTKNILTKTKRHGRSNIPRTQKKGDLKMNEEIKIEEIEKKNEPVNNISSKALRLQKMRTELENTVSGIENKLRQKDEKEKEISKKKTWLEQKEYTAKEFIYSKKDENGKEKYKNAEQRDIACYKILNEDEDFKRVKIEVEEEEYKLKDIIRAVDILKYNFRKIQSLIEIEKLE